MLIFLNNKTIPQNKIVVQVPWDDYFNDYKITKYFDESDMQIVNDVEQTALLNNETIHGKFSDMPIGISCLSEGCKTLLCINHAIKTGTINKYVFNITSCGGNAISYLATIMASNVNIEVYVKHYDFGVSKECCIRIEEKTFNNAILASNALLKLQGDDEYV